MHSFTQPHRLIRRMSVILTASTVVVAVVVPSPAAAAPGSPVETGQLIPLDTLGGRGAAAFDMNKRGDLTGTTGDAAGNSRAVVWRHG